MGTHGSAMESTETEGLNAKRDGLKETRRQSTEDVFCLGTERGRKRNGVGPSVFLL